MLRILSWRAKHPEMTVLHCCTLGRISGFWVANRTNSMHPSSIRLHWVRVPLWEPFSHLQRRSFRQGCDPGPDRGGRHNRLGRSFSPWRGLPIPEKLRKVPGTFCASAWFQLYSSSPNLIRFVALNELSGRTFCKSRTGRGGVGPLCPAERRAVVVLAGRP